MDFQILSTTLWHAQDAQRLSLLAAELTERARSSAETWCVAGNCFSVQKQHETAIECLERAILLNHRFSYAYSLLGHELLDTEHLDKAAAAFRSNWFYFNPLVFVLVLYGSFQT